MKADRLRACGCVLTRVRTYDWKREGMKVGVKACERVSVRLACNGKDGAVSGLRQSRSKGVGHVQGEHSCNSNLHLCTQAYLVYSIPNHVPS